MPTKPNQSKPKRQSSPDASEERLLKQRTLLKANIMRIKKGLEDKTISMNPVELECRLDIVNSYIDDLMVCQTQIEMLDSSDEERGLLEDICVSTKCMLKVGLGKNHSSGSSDRSLSMPHQSRLPKMALPKFSGKYADYKNFMSLFESLVNSDPSIPEIEKFNHLISCLSGDALGTVKAFQISAENYPKALASLKKVYDNTCLIFFDNISKLFELPEVTKPSASLLRKMIDTVSAVYDSLLTLGNDKNITNAIIIHLVMSKVDPDTRSKWEEQLNYDQLPLWTDCEAALNKRYQHISADEASTSKAKGGTHLNGQKSKPSVSKNSKSTFSCSKTQTQSKCFYCSNINHNLQQCESYSTLSVEQRFDFAKGASLCINCLRKGHSVSKCKSPRCRVCNRSHNTLLHRFVTNDNNKTPSSELASTSHTMHTASVSDQVILATAIVKIKKNSGDYILARALLDSGSQVNFVTEELAQKLKLRSESKSLNILSIGKSNTKVTKSLHVCVQSRVNAHEFSADFWVIRSISGYQPDQTINTNSWGMPKNIELADPYFNKSQKVDMLIGAETFFDLLSVGQIKKGSEIPTLQKTLLGWVVSGKYKSTNESISKACNALSQSSELISINEHIQKLWALEEVSHSTKKLTPEHQLCEEHFTENTQLLPSGRIQVKLPFKSSQGRLGSSYEAAKRRFLSLERKLSTNLELHEMYMKFMNEYLALGHMSSTNNEIPNSPHYFIPHQCVLRPQSTTTKLRVVFDASCKTTTQTSLNDILMVGPTIQEELYSILLRFRLHKYALTADITKMYRQVLVSNEDRNCQLIVWRQHPTQPLQIFRLNTVTYGTSPAPFLAIRCLKLLSDAFQDSHSIGSHIIRRDFYVDDLLTGAEDVKTLLHIKTEVTHILKSAGFELAKWFSNASVSNKTQSGEKTLLPNEEASTKTLGLQWHPEQDVFRFELEDNFREMQGTKRNILSVSSRLFDPLGLLSPIVTKAKMLLQELWIKKLDWDESVPLALETSWQNFKSNLLELHRIEVPRYVHLHSTSKYQVHGFADASTKAYGCCLYIRSETADGIKCNLLTAKSRVSPLKTQSIPRLELCAAHLLAKLWNKVSPMLHFKYEKIIFWSDSEIVLHWIKSHPATLNTFVANRVSEIQEWTLEGDWRHVPTKDNPADIVSRGSDIDQLIVSIWFTGPSFLLESSNCWPRNEHFELSVEDQTLEKKKNSHAMHTFVKTPNNFVEFTKHFSSFPKLLRVFAYVWRFVQRIQTPTKKFDKVPNASELHTAFLKLVEIIQHEEFSNEIQKLNRNIPLQPNIQKLNPFLHNFQDDSKCFRLIRVGGRLLNAPISYDAKFPLLLTKNSHLTEIYLRHLHIKNHHAGPKALVAFLREKIWLVNARDACRKIVRSCIHCFRYKPKLKTQIMGNLPADRLRTLRPFLISGVDFCGPIYTTLQIRGRPPVKSYIAVFVCFASKAVHFELVSDLSSDRFIFALKRFIGRRGIPQKLYCDNGTNFVGADRKLAEFRQRFNEEQHQILQCAADEGFEFVYIPPRAPHFGGLWEAAVKSAKSLLQRSVGNAMLTKEELSTVLVEVEAILNSRPLAPLSSDPNDGEALTPAHLLIGGPLRSLPPEPVPIKDIACLQRFQRVCWLKQQFWRQWSRDYMLGLQERHKWTKQQDNVAVGDLVLLHEDNVPPQQWVLGRVMTVVKGHDGMVRVVDVKTTRGILRRAITKLAVLPKTS